MRLINKLFGKNASEMQVMQAQVSVGDAFKTWIESDMGRYIVGRAEQKEADILSQMATVNPRDVDAIICLQSRASAVNAFLSWIEEAVGEGEVAKFQLMEIEE